MILKSSSSKIPSSLILLISLFIQLGNLSALSLSMESISSSRRKILKGLAYTVPTWTISSNIAQAALSQSIINKLDADILTMIEPSRLNNEMKINGIDNLYYPSWLGGTWDARQTLIATSIPLGLKFIGGPSASIAIATESLKEQDKQLNVPVSLQLRFIKTKFGVAEDRLFNTRQRLNAFAGRSVVSSVEYANVNVCNRASVLARGGTEDDPLQTTVVRFKGPAVEKTFLLGHDNEIIYPTKFTAYESLRSIFALTNQNNAPPVTTDTELIWSYDKVGETAINARLRIASYLNSQSDSLFFEAKNRAVSFADYNITLKKVV